MNPTKASANESLSHPGNLLVVSAPSGAGKSSLVKALMELDAGVRASISHTTRAPRGQELDGREYHFVDTQRFNDMVARNEFIEWAHVHGNQYGTSRQAVQDLLQAGQDVMLEIDYQGALQVKEIFPQAILIFILPPSWKSCAPACNAEAKTAAKPSSSACITPKRKCCTPKNSTLL